jgi:hypothetical protein
MPTICANSIVRPQSMQRFYFSPKLDMDLRPPELSEVEEKWLCDHI